MFSQVPVIAVNDGGPTESILNNVTGFLCAPNEKDFSKNIEMIVNNEIDIEKMKKEAKERVVQQFSLDKFSENLHDLVISLSKTQRNSTNSYFLIIIVSIMLFFVYFSTRIFN